MLLDILPGPCAFCPYRKDVPSGVWAEEEYRKLPPYDSETWAQPLEAFACHATPEKLCHGWAVCHNSRGGSRHLIALRLLGIGDVPEPGVPLFSSGQEACDHGMKQVKQPRKPALEAVKKLKKKYRRLK